MRGRVRGNYRVRFWSGAGAGDCPSDHNLAGGSQAEARIRRANGRVQPRAERVGCNAGLGGNAGLKPPPIVQPTPPYVLPTLMNQV